eukprot:3936450-Rhodomonas_salina.1
MVARPDAKPVDTNQEARDARVAAGKLGLGTATFNHSLPPTASRASASASRTSKKSRSGKVGGSKYLDREARCRDSRGSAESTSEASSDSSGSGSGSSSSSDSDSDTPNDDDRAFIKDSSDSEEENEEAVPLKVEVTVGV